MKLTLARKRLLLGSSNVGVIIVLSLILLLSGAPLLLFSNQQVSSLSDILALIIFFFSFAVLQSGFDLIGATACERDDTYSDLKVIFKGLFRGIFVQSLILFISALFISFSSNFFGKVGVVFVLYILFFSLLKFKIKIAKLISPELSFKEIADQKIIVSTKQSFFQGGIHNSNNIFSENLLLSLTNEEVALLDKRRSLIIQSGASRLSEKYAFGVLLIGALVGMFVFRINPNSVAGVIEFALWNSIWSFTCLLILPTFDRKAVFEADRQILLSGIDKLVFESALRKQDTLFDDEKVRSKLIENIFHPIPMLEERIIEINKFELDQQSKPSFSVIPSVPWHTLRHSLYLSWGALNLISRSVHCSVGRPQCWVFLPVE